MISYTGLIKLQQNIFTEAEKMKVKNAEEFYKILERKAIYPVFQPIVNLQTGEVAGYEALSRINKQDTNLMISDLFVIAEQMGCVWKLEKLCRNKALKAAADKPEKAKIFLNVDGNIIQDKSFIQGFTNRKAAKAGVPASDIVFEITERSDIENYQILQQIMNHYANQGYEIALDDVGSGYSGLNRVVNTSPNYLKADIELVRDIHKDKKKELMMKFLLQYCNETGVTLIAEGIETDAELECLHRLGVHYGQGYFLGRPNKGFESVSDEAMVVLQQLNTKSQ